MKIEDFFIFTLTGKLLLFLSRKFPPFRSIMSKDEFLRELYSCDLCLGFWIYLILALFSKNINVEHIKNKYAGKFVVAAFTTFIMHLISTGWDENFGTVYLEDAYGKSTR